MKRSDVEALRAKALAASGTTWGVPAYYEHVAACSPERIVEVLDTLLHAMDEHSIRNRCPGDYCPTAEWDR